MKKKVLFLVNHEVVIYNFRKELVEEFLSKDYEVIISSPPGEKIDRLVAMGCEFVETNVARHGKNPLNDIKLFFTYVKIIKKYKPDVILTYTIKPNIFGGIAAIVTNVPYVTNITGLGTALENKGILQILTKNLYKVALKKVNMLFFQNEENKTFFQENVYNLSQHKVLPGSGVNINHFGKLSYPNDKNGVSFVFISRIMKEKGIEYYLEAAEHIKKKYPSTSFHICGFCEEEYEGKLQFFEDKGVIKYHGMIDDVRSVLEFSHCIIHPSYYPEGLSNVLLESASCGRPIITTNRSGCREVVDHEVNGYITNVKNSEELISSIEMFLKLSNSEREMMGNNSRKKIEKDFDRKIVVSEYLNLVENITS